MYIKHEMSACLFQDVKTLKDMGDEIAKKQSTVDKLSARYTKLLQNKPEVVQQHMAPLRVGLIIRHDYTCITNMGKCRGLILYPHPLTQEIM